MKFLKALELSMTALFVIFFVVFIGGMYLAAIWSAIISIGLPVCAGLVILWLGLAYVIRLWSRWNPDIGLEQFKNEC